MNHIGRPTIKEVKAKKRQKFLKMFFPIIIIIIVLIVLNEKDSLSSLMSNSTNNCSYYCDKEGELVDNKCTYSQDVEEQQDDAILIGDANKDGKISIKDYSIIQMSINSDKTISKEEEIIYDLNKDGIINEKDISIDYFSSTDKKSELSKQYACFPDEEKYTIDSEGYEVIETNKYELRGEKCYLNQTITKLLTPTKKCSTSTSSNNKNTIFKSSHNYTPKKGDIIFFSYDDGKSMTHTGIVYQVKNNNIVTIEGSLECKNGDTKSYCSNNQPCNCNDNEYKLKHSKVAIKTYKNYKNNNNIVGYIKTSDIISYKNIVEITSLAYKQKNEKGIKYLSSIKSWDGDTINEWSSIFIAWIFEQKRINLDDFGWSAGTNTWSIQAKKIKSNNSI